MKNKEESPIDSLRRNTSLPVPEGTVVPCWSERFAITFMFPSDASKYRPDFYA